MINVRSSKSNKPCTVEVARIWHGQGDFHPVETFPSIRAALENLAFAIYDAVDHLSSASYDLRLVLADGTVKPLSNNRQGYAIEQAKAMRWDDSIGARWARGETVVV